MSLHADTPVVHSDGSLRFSGRPDGIRQLAVADALERRLNVRLVAAGELSFLDYLALRDERPIAWCEVIERAYTWADLKARGGVWLKLKTYETALAAAQVPLSVDWKGSLIFWKLADLDCLWWINVQHLEADISEAYDPRGATNDREPAILVKNLKRLQL